MCAVLASLDMAAERGCPAELDGRHDPALDPPEMAVMITSIGWTMVAEDIRHLQFGSHDPGSDRRHHLQRQAIERALYRTDRPG